MKIQKLEEVRKNVHQTHLEDLVLLGKEGFDELYNHIDNFINKLENKEDKINTTVKIDGAPAVVCWHEFPGYPNDSICLKSFINGPEKAKVISSEEELRAGRYADSPKMLEMLSYCLELAKHIPSGEAWQGDCLFTKDTKQEREINGKNYITFLPNTIIYAFSEDNPGYENIKNADFGIAFHTIYSGSADNLSQSFRVDASRLNLPNNIYVLSPVLNSSTNKEDYGIDEILNLEDQLSLVESDLVNDPAYNELANNKEFQTFWGTFENKNYADNKLYQINVDTLIDELNAHLDNRASKMSKVGVGRVRDIINNNKGTLTNMVKALNIASQIKMLLWKGFNSTSKFDYDSFYHNEETGEYIPTTMEGVAMSDDDGNIVKIVDRPTFASNNRNQAFAKGFKHESLEEDVSDKGEIVFAFGRMNPPTKGHEKLINFMSSISNKNKPRLYLSHTQDKKKNPLSYEDKIEFVKKLAEPKVDVIDTDLRELLYIVVALQQEGFSKITLVCGKDRIDSFRNLLLAYNGKTLKDGSIYNFPEENINVISAGDRDPDSDDPLIRASATNMRKYASDNDFESFKENSPFDEGDSHELFNKVRAGLGLRESLLVESGSNNILNKLRTWLNKYITDSNIESMTYRDGDEIYRFRVKDVSKVDDEEQYTLDFIKNLISKAKDEIKLKNEINLKDFKVKDIQEGKYENFSRVAETSRKYRDVEIIFTLVDNDGVETQNTFYACVNTGETKTLIPNKVMKPIVGVNYQSLSQYVKDDIPLKETLQEILTEASQDNRVSFDGDLDDLTINGGFKINFTVSDSVKDFIYSNRSAVIDFSEVFGSVVLSNSISQLVSNKDTKITFPTASNEKLLDYKIEYHNNSGSGIAKISAKAGVGGAPSSSSLSEAIIDYYSQHKVPKNLIKGYEFIKWLDRNVTKQSVDKGFSNLRDLVVDISNGSYPNWVDDDLAGQIRFHEDIIKEVTFLSSSPDDDLSEYVRDLQQKLSDEIHGLNLGRLKSLTFEKAKAKPELYNTFVKSIKDKLLSSVAVFYLNRDDNLINEMNLLFREAYGPLIQIHLEEPDGSNLLKFYTKTTETKNFKFIQNTGIDSSEFRMLNQRLAMRMAS